MGKVIAVSLTLVRHGETIANRENVIQGQIDTCLSDIGRHQASKAGERLRNERWTHVFASDLKRASQTAQVIVDTNKSNPCSVTNDKRLRERKYGVMEGKTFRELTAMARSKNLTITNYTPCGAEHIDEVRNRAKAFFQEMLNLLKNGVEDVDYTPASINTRCEHGINSVSSDSAGLLGCEAVSTNKSTSNASMEKPISKRPRRELDSDCSVSLLELSTSSFNDVQPANKCQKVVTPSVRLMPSIMQDILLYRDKFGTNCVEDREQTKSISDRMNESSKISSTIDSLKLTNSSASSNTNNCEIVKVSSELEREKNLQNPSLLHSNFKDSDIKTIIRQKKNANVDCPNVSLSPLLEHRLSSVSSVSSDRNSSFDDTDGMPLFVADVLVVSHGGFLKELIRHFLDDFKCKIPGNKGHALRVGPNASLSKFTITIDEVTGLPVITCLLLHDKDHLVSVEFASTSADT